ncbi:hypothetical protein ACP275_05G123600 [Erythranthe tilingii]
MDIGSNPKCDGNFFKYCGGDHRKNHHSTAAAAMVHHHHHGFGGAFVKIVLVFVVIGLTFVFVNKSDNSTRFVDRSSPPSFDVVEADKFKSDDLSSYGREENNLENTLRRAAMEDQKTVIITTLNAAWTEPNSIFDLFLESFKIGDRTQNLLKHLVVVALDQKAYSRCLEAHLHCFALAGDGRGGGGEDFSGLAYFMGGKYLKIMWKRIDFLRTVLEMGYNFVFSDADVMWLRDPFPRFYPDGDFQIACDIYNHNSTDLGNLPNGGFTYVKSNNRTIQFYKFWYNGKDYFPGKHDQDVFNLIKFDPFISDIGLGIRFLDTAYFGGFCQPSKDLDLVVTMHANCCIGFEKKIRDIAMVIDDWKGYMGNHNSGRVSWTAPRECGLNKTE